MRPMLSWITANADSNICNIMTWHSGDENRHDDLCCHASLPPVAPTPVTWPDTVEMNMDMMRLMLSWITAHTDSNTSVTWQRKQENKLGRHPGNSWNMHFHSLTNSRPKKWATFVSRIRQGRRSQQKDNQDSSSLTKQMLTETNVPTLSCAKAVILPMLSRCPCDTIFHNAHTSPTSGMLSAGDLDVVFCNKLVS